MKLLYRLELANAQPLGSSRYHINKPHIVLITSILAVIAGLAVIASVIALLVIYHAQSSAIFNGILISIVLGVILILCIGGRHSCIILQLARLHSPEVSGSESVIQKLQTYSQDLQNRLSEEDCLLQNQRNHEIEEALQMQTLLKSKQNELNSLTHRYAAMAQEHADLEKMVSRLRKELVELKHTLEGNQVASHIVIERLQASNELLKKESIIARQSEQAEKLISGSLRFCFFKQNSELQGHSALIFLKDQTIEELTNKVAELRGRISSLQLFLTDNLESREQNRGFFLELSQKLITLKSKLQDLLLLITDNTKNDQITTPTGNSLIEFVNALDVYASGIQEFMNNALF